MLESAVQASYKEAFGVVFVGLGGWIYPSHSIRDRLWLSDCRFANKLPEPFERFISTPHRMHLVTLGSGNPFRNDPTLSRVLELAVESGAPQGVALGDDGGWMTFDNLGFLYDGRPPVLRSRRCT